MKKILVLSLAALVVAVSLAFAGFDQYTSKNYTTLLKPTLIADNSAAITNSTVTGVDVAGLIGNGCVVFGYQCTGGGADAVLTFKIQSCATTNGTYVTYTNADGVASWAVTNAASFLTMKFRPNAVSRYLRTVVTPSGAVTNASASVLLVTE